MAICKTFSTKLVYPLLKRLLQHQIQHFLKFLILKVEFLNFLSNRNHKLNHTQFGAFQSWVYVLFFRSEER